MGYHPETMVCSFPPYPKGGRMLDGSWREPRWSLAAMLYALKPFIGFDIWHIDPERRSKGQRTDDSCGWFDRRPREYADAVAYVLADTDAMFEIRRSLSCAGPVTGAYGHTYPRMSSGETLALCLMVARYLELRRWWNGANGKSGAHASIWRRAFTRARRVDDIATELALNPLDNLSAPHEPEETVRLIAAALHRRFKPWWKHPRWHVHHWRINFDLPRNLRRMLIDRCATCRKPLGFGRVPHSNHLGLHHCACLGRGEAASYPAQSGVNAAPGMPSN